MPKFPEILYQASSIAVTKQGDALYSATLNGSLSLHGVTNSQPLTARVAVFEPEPPRASGEFRLRQSEYRNQADLRGRRHAEGENERCLSFENRCAKAGISEIRFSISASQRSHFCDSHSRTFQKNKPYFVASVHSCSPRCSNAARSSSRIHRSFTRSSIARVYCAKYSSRFL